MVSFAWINSPDPASDRARIGLMKVRVLLFAVLRDLTGVESLEVELAEGAGPADAWRELRSRHATLAPFQEPPLAAVNEEYATPGVVLHDGDELAFIPPVSGG